MTLVRLKGLGFYPLRDQAPLKTLCFREPFYSICGLRHANRISKPPVSS
jgi:hypothetical protein